MFVRIGILVAILCESVGLAPELPSIRIHSQTSSNISNIIKIFSFDFPLSNGDSIDIYCDFRRNFLDFVIDLNRTLSKIRRHLFSDDTYLLNISLERLLTII